MCWRDVAVEKINKRKKKMNIQAHVQAPHQGDRSQGREAESDDGDERRGEARHGFRDFLTQGSEVLNVIVVPF
jgi:hypothetical protein